MTTRTPQRASFRPRRGSVIEVSVIIPALNQAKTLAACLRSLEEQDYPRDRFEIIVVDNGSSDETAAVAERFGVTCLSEEKHSSYAARNRGVEAASGRILAFLDGDCRAAPGWLSSAVQRFDDEACDLLAGCIVPTSSDDPNLYEIYDGLKYLNQQRSVSRRRYGVTANLFVARETMDDVGGFDGGFVSGGDRDFCLSAHERGHTLAYEEDAVVYHDTRSTLDDILEKNERIGFGTIQSLRKRPAQFPTALPMLLFLLPRHRFLMDLFRGTGARSRFCTFRLFLLDWLAKQAHALGCLKAAVGVRRARPRAIPAATPAASDQTHAQAAPHQTQGHVPRWIVLGSLLLFCSLAFANALGNGFCFDDRPYIEKSEEIHDIANLPSMFGLDGSLSYRPVRQASYAIDLWLWGMNPFGFHLTNLLLHAATTLLVFFFVRQLARGQTSFAWIAAALFALHPVHTESVTYVSGRKDVLCTFFGLFSMISFHRLITSARSMRWWAVFGHTFWAGLTFLLAVGSKEMALAFLPLMVVVFLLPKIRDAGNGRRLRDLVIDGGRVLLRYRYAIAAFLILCVGLLVFYMTKSRATSADYHGGSPWNTLQTVGRIQLLYLLRMVAPFRLVGDYHQQAFRVTEHPFDLESIAALAVLGALLLGLLALTRRWYFVALGGLWYFVSMIPVSHIRPHHELLAERFLYLPSIGFCIALAAVIHAARLGRYRRHATLALAILLIAFGTRTHLRNRDWKDDMTFWAVTREQVPTNARAHIYYAYNLYYAGKVQEAIQSARRGLELHREFYSGHYNLARMYEGIGAYHDAIEAYEIEVSMFANEDAYFNLGSLYGRLGRFADAEETFQTALRFFSPTAEVLYYLGLACEKQQKEGEAKKWYRKALAKDPSFALADRQLRGLGR